MLLIPLLTFALVASLASGKGMGGIGGSKSSKGSGSDGTCPDTALRSAGTTELLVGSGVWHFCDTQNIGVQATSVTSVNDPFITSFANGGAGLKFKQVTDSPYSGDGSVLDGYEASLSWFEAGPPFQPFPARVVEQRTVGLFEYATSSPATSNEMLMQPTSNVQYFWDCPAEWFEYADLDLCTPAIPATGVNNPADQFQMLCKEFQGDGYTAEMNAFACRLTFLRSSLAAAWANDDPNDKDFSRQVKWHMVPSHESCPCVAEPEYHH